MVVETLRFPAGCSRDRKMHQLTCAKIADVVAILPKWRATGPDGVPNEAVKVAPLVMVSELVTLLQKVYTGGRVPSAWHQVSGRTEIKERWVGR